jgi:hypothetical protein
MPHGRVLKRRGPATVVGEFPQFLPLSGTQSCCEQGFRSFYTVGQPLGAAKPLSIECGTGRFERSDDPLARRPAFYFRLGMMEKSSTFKVEDYFFTLRRENKY